MSPCRKHMPLVVTMWIVVAAVAGGCSGDDEAAHGSMSYVAISGGGFRSQVAQAAWTLGMMAASGSENLEELMRNVDAIASNSGGTWFTTQLAFSESFKTAMEMPDAASTYMTDGYMGTIREIYKDSTYDCSELIQKNPLLGWLCRGVDILAPWLYMVELTGAEEVSWVDLVNAMVYAPFYMNLELEGVMLDGPRQSWAKGKALILSASMLTNEVILNDRWFEGLLGPEGFYDVGGSPGMPEQVTATPVAIVSADRDVVVPDFFTAGQMPIKYGNNACSPERHGSTIVLPEKQDLSSLPVIQAAAISSAAAAVAASAAVLENSTLPLKFLHDPQIAYLLRNLAPSFSMKPSGISYVPDIPHYFGAHEFSEESLIRMADGGYTDNLSVAYMLRFLLDNGQIDGFNIVSFFNTNTDFILSDAIPEQMAWLFGYGEEDGLVVRSVASGLGLKIMAPTVFDQSGLDNAQVLWSYTNTDDSVSLRYVRCRVVTVENKNFGIDAGHEGIVHFFVVQAPKAPAIPLSPDSFDAYESLMNTTFDAVMNHGGWNWLKTAFRMEP